MPQFNKGRKVYVLNGKGQNDYIGNVVSATKNTVAVKIVAAIYGDTANGGKTLEFPINRVSINPA